AGSPSPPRMPGSCCARAAVHGRHSTAIETVRARRFRIILSPRHKDSASVLNWFRASMTVKVLQVLHYRQLSVTCQSVTQDRANAYALPLYGLMRVHGPDLNPCSLK